MSRDSTAEPDASGCSGACDPHVRATAKQPPMRPPAGEGAGGACRHPAEQAPEEIPGAAERVIRARTIATAHPGPAAARLAARG